MRQETRGLDLASLRRLNSTAVLRTLRRRSPQTIGQLTGSTGLSRPTVEALVEELAARGWIADAAGSGPAGRGPGRPARHFRFRAEAGRAVGIDIGRRKAVLALSGLDGEVLATEREPLDPALTGVQRVDYLRNRLDRFLADHGVRPKELWAVGVGVPGRVDETGRIRSLVVPDWTDLDLARRLADTVPCRVIVENDANLAVLAEHWRGAATLADDVVCVLAGQRISCGLMIDGRLHRGRRGGAGELGLLPQLGRAGHTAGAPAPAQTGPAALAGPPALGEPLARGVRDGAPGAVAALDRYLDGLAPGVAAIVLAVDPELVVVSGAVAPVGAPLVPRLAERLSALVLDVPRIEVSALGRENIALGALRAALDSVDSQLLDGTGPLPEAAR